MIFHFYCRKRRRGSRCYAVRPGENTYKGAASKGLCPRSPSQIRPIQPLKYKENETLNISVSHFRHLRIPIAIPMAKYN